MPDDSEKNLDPINSLSLFGLDNFFLNFTNLFKNNNYPKVSLLTGDKGNGKFTLAFHFINYVLSRNSKNPYKIKEQTIDKDSLVYKQILSNTCQNFIYISNENEKKAGIENIREIKRKINNSLLNDLPRFIVFDDVELLNLNAANSLLKFIEEPSKLNYFILINNKKQNIIETVKSRAIETKIFLNKSKKLEVFNNLTSHHNLEEHFSHEFIDFTTPGRLIKYSENLRSLDIDINASFYDITNTLLTEFKKTKNQTFFDCIGFFLEIKYSQNKYTNSGEFINFLNEKNNIMKLLYNYKKFNLTNNSILEYIKKSEAHYA